MKSNEYKHLVNSAGLQALEVAEKFGVGDDLSIFPMKGLYCMSKKPLDHLYKTIVYPIPLPGAYTLGVHSTMTPDGFMKIGPTTSPAFSLENYQGFEKINMFDIRRIVKSYSLIMRSKQRALIWDYLYRDLPKHSIKILMNDINKIHRMDIGDFNSTFYTRPGIRAQLVNKTDRMLITDFMLRKQEPQPDGSFSRIHLLNISSPGWTSAFPFTDRIVSELLGVKESEMPDLI